MRQVVRAPTADELATGVFATALDRRRLLRPTAGGVGDGGVLAREGVPRPARSRDRAHVLVDAQRTTGDRLLLAHRRSVPRSTFPTDPSWQTEPKGREAVLVTPRLAGRGDATETEPRRTRTCTRYRPTAATRAHERRELGPATRHALPVEHAVRARAYSRSSSRGDSPAAGTVAPRIPRMCFLGRLAAREAHLAVVRERLCI